MRCADQHIHCTCSFDAEGTLPEMIAAAERAGLRAVCFTDHLDMADERTGLPSPLWDRERFDARRREHETLADGQGVEVRFGVELGEPCQAEETAKTAVAELQPDLVIGSVHNVPRIPDFYHLRYESEEECERLDRLYLRELLHTAELDCFDVMGHIGYTSRYMSAQGFTERITVAKYGDELTALFEKLIDNGKGIECNASPYRGGGAETYPGRDVLALYRELGGEIITVGSDAHVPAQVGVGLGEVYAMLRELGFLYVTEFRGREPLFITIT